jgi:glutathione S-transferase
MRTLWLLYELDLDFELVVHPFGKELRDPSYLALNPVGRVPALQVGGRVLTETGAIAEILCERYPASGLGRAVGSPEREEFLVWLHFAETMSTHCQILTQQHIMLYQDHMRSPTVMKLEALRLEKTYEAVERQLSDGRAFLVADGFSAADIAVGQAVYMARQFAKTTPFQRLENWYTGLTARPAFQKSLPPEGAELLYTRDFYEPWDG